MISHFSQEPFEGTLHIEDADLQKMAKVLNDVNIKECPYFDLSDKYGNSARYYRENQWIPCSEELPKNGISVLFCDDEGDIYNGYCLVKDGGRYHIWMEYHNADRIKNVVAWMHWPEPWKEKEE